MTQYWNVGNTAQYRTCFNVIIIKKTRLLKIVYEYEIDLFSAGTSRKKYCSSNKKVQVMSGIRDTKVLDKNASLSSEQTFKLAAVSF